MTFGDADSFVERARQSLSRMALALATVLLAVGLGLAETNQPEGSGVMLGLACALLLAIPVLNLFAALLEEVGRRDWPFVAAALLVLALVAYSVLVQLG